MKGCRFCRFRSSCLRVARCVSGHFRTRSRKSLHHTGVYSSALKPEPQSKRLASYFLIFKYFADSLLLFLPFTENSICSCISLHFPQFLCWCISCVCVFICSARSVAASSSSWKKEILYSYMKISYMKWKKCEWFRIRAHDDVVWISLCCESVALLLDV